MHTKRLSVSTFINEFLVALSEHIAKKYHNERVYISRVTLSNGGCMIHCTLIETDEVFFAVRLSKDKVIDFKYYHDGKLTSADPSSLTVEEIVGYA